MPLNSSLRRLLTFAALVAALAAARGETPADRLVLGTVYNIFPEEFATDADFFHQVDRDLPAIAAAGFTHVMIFPMSEWDPDTHALRWTRTDYLVHRIEALHLKFVPLLLKEEQCSHYFPIWKFQELGLWDARNVDNGNPNNRENVDFADPRIRPLVDDYLRAVAGRYGSSPALAFYNLWNEPHYQSTAPHVLARFRTWLQHKYGTLAALRRAWGDDFSDWSQVSPLLTDDWNSSMPGIDWRLFRNELDGDLLAELREVVRRCDPHHPVNANPVGTPFASFGPFGGYNTDNWQFTPAEDFAGASYYPDAWARAHGLDRAPAWFHDLNFTVFRCAAAPKDYILTELYTNAKTGLTLGGYLDADTARELAWTAFANDCKGLIYWKWDPFRRGRQSLGRGLVDLEGRLAPRGEAVASVAAAVGRHEALIRTARLAPAQIAIAVDMVGLLKVLQQPAEPRTQNFMYESIAGVFQALDRANLTVDLLRVDRGVSLADLQRYHAVILPFQVVIRRDFATALRAYVEGGGHVLADARTGTLDEQDFAYAPSPGAGLADLFGASFVDTIRAARRETPEGASLYRVPLEIGAGADKRSLLINTAIAPFQTEDETQAGWIIVLEDVTDRANLEEQLRLSEKMAAIGLLAAGVAHEVNTPLTGISSFTQMLLDRSEPGDPKTQLLLAGDTLYPGRLYVPANWSGVFRESVDRLAQFVREHPVSHILGAHIEMTTTPGKDYGHEAPTHRNEHVLELPPEAAYELQRVTDSTDFAKPAVTDDFIVFPVEARPPDPAGAELPLAKAAP